MKEKRNTGYISRGFEQGTHQAMSAIFFFFSRKKVECIFSLRNRWTGKDDNTEGKRQVTPGGVKGEAEEANSRGKA